MPRPEHEVFRILGPDGLARVLGDVFDSRRLVDLANASGLKYPGMRTQTQTRERVVTDLARRALEHEPTRKTVSRALQKETAQASAAWSALAPAERQARLADDEFLRDPGKLGLQLYLLARDSGASDDLGRLLALVAPAEPSAADAPGTGPTEPDRTREESRLRKRAGELQKKLAYLEAQLGKSRETEKAIKRDLIQRKGELAESRMLAERLRTELAAAQAAMSKAASATPTPTSSAAAGGGSDKVSQALRRLATEQRQLAQEIGRLATAAEQPPAEHEAATAVREALARIEQRLARPAADRDRDRGETTKSLEALTAEIASLKRHLTRPPRRVKTGGEARVGVFIDVQNVYYGARRLKGKLDFDALLQAAVGGRRLIQATAYVVESQDIDQSGFIALLQQRAIEVRRKALRVRADGSMKGDWDMELALDILDAAPRLDIVVLVSGDGDFTSLVKRVKGMGPRVEVLGFPRHTAKSLVEAADDFHPLDRRLMIQPERPVSMAKPQAESEDEPPAPAPDRATAASA